MGEPEGSLPGILHNSITMLKLSSDKRNGKKDADIEKY